MDGDDGTNGTDGVSPTFTVTDITGGHRLTIVDAQGTHTVDLMDGTNGTNGTNGSDGVSPTISSSSITGGHRLSITDKNGTSTVDVMDGQNGTNGTNGADGVSPTISSSSITGGHRLTITDKNGTSTVDVMDGQTGQTGQTGATGADGYSPTASVSKSGGTATITITDKNGTTTAQVSDGQNGQNGSNGNDGYSPTATVTKSGSTATISITDKNGTTTATVSDGAAGTTDYTDMTNKPQINSVTLSGNKSFSDLGIHNLPPSGSSGQVLAKSSNTDYAVQWKTNSLASLSDTYIDSVVEGNVIAGSMYGDWRSQPLRVYMGCFMDIGEGEIALFFDDGNLPGYEPSPGFGGYIVNNDSEEQEEYDFLWQHLVTNEYGEYQSTEYWFLCKSQSTPYDLKIKRFAATFDNELGEWSNLTEQTAPDTHEVSHTWIGTAAEYAALSPNYDAHTIYYITQ